MVNKYQIREAAGMYWILKMNQSGYPYEEPLPVNAVGAEIFNLLELKKSQQEIVEELCRRYEQPEEVIEKDVLAFITQLRERGFE